MEDQRVVSEDEYENNLRDILDDWRDYTPANRAIRKAYLDANPTFLALPENQNKIRRCYGSSIIQGQEDLADFCKSLIIGEVDIKAIKTEIFLNNLRRRESGYGTIMAFANYGIELTQEVRSACIEKLLSGGLIRCWVAEIEQLNTILSFNEAEKDQLFKSMILMNEEGCLGHSLPLFFEQNSGKRISAHVFEDHDVQVAHFRSVLAEMSAFEFRPYEQSSDLRQWHFEGTARPKGFIPSDLAVEAAIIEWLGRNGQARRRRLLNATPEMWWLREKIEALSVQIPVPEGTEASGLF
jgi:hypothetical protein